MGTLARLKWSALVVATVAALGCASTGGVTATETEPTGGTPLASMASRPLLVLPVQYVSFADSLDWRQQFSPVGPLLAALDDSIASALTGRGLKSWTFGSAITASAKRNAGMTADPHALAAERLQRMVKASDVPLSEPLASQIRSLVALRDARYVVLPVILHFENRGAGARGSLLLYLIDARTSRILWSGEVGTDAPRTSFPTVAGGIAERVADLVVAR